MKKRDAVTVYSEDIVIVQSEGKIKSIERRVYKILRPGGRDRGIACGAFDWKRKITNMNAWCIPAQGKDYEVKDKEALDVSLEGAVASQIDLEMARMRSPENTGGGPGNIIGYEIEHEDRPYIFAR